ncbi:protein ZNRD2 [Amazona ochrocephala]
MDGDPPPHPLPSRGVPPHPFPPIFQQNKGFTDSLRPLRPLGGVGGHFRTRLRLGAPPPCGTIAPAHGSHSAPFRSRTLFGARAFCFVPPGLSLSARLLRRDVSSGASPSPQRHGAERGRGAGPGRGGAGGPAGAAGVGQPRHGAAAAAGVPHAGPVLPPLRDHSAADKDQKLHCVSCQDLDFESGPAPEPATASSPPPPRPPPEHREGPAPATSSRGAPPAPPEVAAARAAVLAKLGWAARELPRTGSAEGSAHLCALVRACAEALGGLQALAPPAGPP